MSVPAPSAAALPPLLDGWLLPALRPLLHDAVEHLDAGRGQSVWDAVVAGKLLSETELVHAAARHLGIPVADFSSTSRQAIELVSERWARQFQIVPLSVSDDELLVATSAPYDLDCEHALAFAAGRAIAFALAGKADLARRIDELYRGGATGSGPERHVEVQHLSRDHDVAPPTAGEDGSSTITHLVDELLGAGVARHASDIHIEPEERGIAIRHRVDGVLRHARTLPRSLGPALVSRIKILSGLDIADRLRPQDGRARVAVNGAAVDLRVSTLPASHGEKVVIRVLDGGSAVVSLEGMGFSRDELHRLDDLLQAREGLILVTGPTGSGKTTTLYAALRKLKERGVNIVTVEDPIEYRLPGIVQVQVHDRAGLTFASALRSIMRQDPDVLLVGEIRDRETAEIAIQASLTGHLVLSTLHTNDAASAVTRLVDIGIPSYKIAGAVKGIVAQRLIRRLCPRCRRATRHGDPVSGQAANLDADFVAHGCSICGHTGYRGRLAVVEVLLASPEFERRVAIGDSAERIAAACRDDGMATLWQSGLDHVHRGDTSIHELRRVVSPDHSSGKRWPDRERYVRQGESGVVRMDSAASGSYLQRRSPSSSHDLPELALPQISIGTVDIYVIRPLAAQWQILALQRAVGTRCPTSWETVHGHLEPGEEPEDAALRELREETGLTAARLYNVTVQPFYLHRTHVVQLAVVFAALVDEPASVTIGVEHQSFAWLGVDDALGRFHWPRARVALRETIDLLSSGDAGPVEDVLRVR